MFYFVQDALQIVKKEISKMVQKRLNITFCTQNAAQSVFPQVYSRIYEEPVTVAGAYEKMALHHRKSCQGEQKVCGRLFNLKKSPSLLQNAQKCGIIEVVFSLRGKPPCRRKRNEILALIYFAV